MLNPMLLCDFYKLSHRKMYPPGTELVYSTWTARASRIPGVNKVVFFGLQAFIKNYLCDFFDKHFFKQDIQVIINDYKEIVSSTLGDKDPDVSHIVELHKLGYLPLRIEALPEGSVVDIRVPLMVVYNTDPRFFWLTNYIETLASCELWQPTTSATIANEYRKVLKDAALKTVGNDDFVKFQGHDFSMRGLSSLHSAILSGMGHLTSFVGTDTIPAIICATNLYFANFQKELIGTSIPATEHSIQCAYKDDLTYFGEIIQRVHPSGLVSIVADGYDYWYVMEKVVPAIKQNILNRDGKVVIRPDSGDPVLIVCGDPSAPEHSLQRKGAVEALWDIFGGTLTENGYKLLDSHIGLIYGDAITLQRACEIMQRLQKKGFASINVVFGIGSYTYQYNTRDTFGFALKSTLCVINGKEKQIFKCPKTDDGIKISQKGAVLVQEYNKSFNYTDEHSLEYCQNNSVNNKLKLVFLNGSLVNTNSLEEIRQRIISYDT